MFVVLSQTENQTGAAGYEFSLVFQVILSSKFYFARCYIENTQTVALAMHQTIVEHRSRTEKWRYEPFVMDALVAYCGAMLVTVERLTKTYGKFTAVDDVSFVVHAGEIAGLVGPNGAGKTTIIHMMLGLISPNAGSVRLFGKSLETDREQILQRLNFTSPYMAFPVRLTVLENLRVFAGIYNVRNPAVENQRAVGEIRDRATEEKTDFEVVLRRDHARRALQSISEQSGIAIARRADRLPRSSGGGAGERGSARSAEEPRDDDPLYVAQHARGRADVRPDPLSQQGKYHRDRNSYRSNSRNPERGSQCTCSRRGLHSHCGASAR